MTNRFWDGYAPRRRLYSELGLNYDSSAQVGISTCVSESLRPKRQDESRQGLFRVNQTIPLIESERQMFLWNGDRGVENPEYLSRQLITYIGNKRALLGRIGGAVERVKLRLGKDKLAIFDAFSGSGVVSRFFKAHASLLVSNDIERYAAVIARCYLSNKSDVDFAAVRDLVDEMNDRVDAAPFPTGFIEELYAPKDESRITKEDRVFYTKKNARRLDNYRRLIEDSPAEFKYLLLGPLLSEASVHTNTAGIFKGFYKNRNTGVGQFGGVGADALTRIMGEIRLEPPILSDFECDCIVYQEDATGQSHLVDFGISNTVEYR